MKKHMLLVVVLGFACLVSTTALADPSVTELAPPNGCHGGTLIKVIGSGFGNHRSGMGEGNEGYYSFVSFAFNDAPDPDTIIATQYLLWSHQEIQVVFARLFSDQIDEDENENYIQDGDEPFLRGLDTGQYIVTVHTIQFQDNGNGIYDEEDIVVSHAFSGELVTFNVAEANISVSLIPEDSLFSRGETLGCEVILTNDSDATTTVFLATKIVRLDREVYPSSGFLIGPKRVTLSSHRSISAHLGFPLSQSAPLGNHQYWAGIGLYGVGFIDVDHFDFRVVKPGRTCMACH